LIGQVWHARRATLVLGGASVARLRASCEETNQPEGAPGAGGLRSLRLGNRRRTARQKDGRSSTYQTGSTDWRNCACSRGTSMIGTWINVLGCDVVIER
jgi:hypothetical protein